MNKALPLPKPLFDTLANLDEMPSCVFDFLNTLAIPHASKEYNLVKEFLRSYAHSQDTFNAYRREVERLLQWSWLIAKKTLQDIKRNDIRDFLKFIQNPPMTWISTHHANRFMTNKLQQRCWNEKWRPFVTNPSKINRRHNLEASKNSYQLSSKSMQVIFAILSSLFSFLQQEEYVETNPISLVRQKKAYIQRQQTKKVTRKLSKIQWHAVISTAENMSKENIAHLRTLFLMSAFYLLGVRISELAYTENRYATMGSFAPDKRGFWWFTTIGKGNKLRDVAVPDELLELLKSYRTSLALSPLPARDEATPLLPKRKGKGGLGIRQIRSLVQEVFNLAIVNLQSAGKMDEAEDLATATVHWLRHTAISTDIEFRPREHIRDDVGHENPATMEKYIDTDRIARHQSAKSKRLKPILEETEI